MRVVEKYNQDTLKVKFYGMEKDEFYSVLNGVKDIPGRKFHQSSKSWLLPMNDISVNKLIALGFDVLSVKGGEKKKERPKIDIDIEGLYPFQKDGVSFLIEKNGKALIGDEMGTGKTIQALAYLNMMPDLRPALIICPASLKLNWKKEAEKWLNKKEEDIQVLYGSNTSDLYGDIVICNYDIVDNNFELLKNYNFKCIILDEVHKIKNEKAKRTKAIKKLCRGIESIIGLSGTPILNRPIEIFNILNILQPRLFPNRWGYAKKYCCLKHNGFGWDMNGASNIEELNEILKSTVMIRRLKKDVLKDLPPKQISVVPFDINNRGEYEDARNDLIDWIENNYDKDKAEKASKVEHLVKFEYLKKLAAIGKMKEIKSWINDFIDTEDKLVIMATHHDIIDDLVSFFKDIAVKIDGRDSVESRQASVDAFQNDSNIKLFVGNIKAAGEGITLTAASSLAFVELGWTPGEHNQAEDRIHRIGQEDSVNIYYLISENSIEEELAAMLDEKRKVLSAVLDGEKITEDSESLISNLMKKYSKK